MPDTVAVRLLQHQYDRVTLSAEASGLKVGQWIRLAVQGRLSGEMSASLTLVRQGFALRVLLLNTLLYLGPAEPGLKLERLMEISASADSVSERQAQKLLSRVVPVVEVLPGSPSAARERQVGARLTETQYQEVSLAAEAAGVTVTEWVRETIVGQLTRDESIYILAQQLLGLRAILDDVLRVLTSGSNTIERGILAELTKRTDPNTLQITHPYNDRSSTKR